jgi:hydroxyacylglutathione hydrolase
MLIERYTGPPVDTHAYLIVDESTHEAWVIDAPLDTAGRILEYCRENNLNLTRLILTHGHFDHILDAPVYQAAGIPVAAHPEERAILKAPQTEMFGLPYAMPSFELDELLEEGGCLSLGGDRWEVWHVPGHSPGHILLYSPAGGVVFGGDLLFQGGYGRTDVPGADPAGMAASLKRLLQLPPGTRVYPGHGPDTTVGTERAWLAGLLG